MKVGTSWRLRRRAMPQAGNRARKIVQRAQWWDSTPECGPVPSARPKATRLPTVLWFDVYLQPKWLRYLLASHLGLMRTRTFKPTNSTPKRLKRLKKGLCRAHRPDVYLELKLLRYLLTSHFGMIRTRTCKPTNSKQNFLKLLNKGLRRAHRPDVYLEPKWLRYLLTSHFGMMRTRICKPTNSKPKKTQTTPKRAAHRPDVYLEPKWLRYLLSYLEPSPKTGVA